MSEPGLDLRAATFPSQPPPAAGDPGRFPRGALPGGEWGPLRVLGGVALVVLASLVAISVVGAFDSDLESLAARLTLQGTLAASLVAAAFVMVRGDEIASTGRVASAARLGLGRSMRSPFGAAALVYLGYIAVAFALSPLLQPEQEDVTRELGFGQGTLGTVAAGFLIVIAAPVAEEVFFRGFMFAGIRSRAPWIVAALISGLVWGAVHFTGPDSWGVVVQLSVFGVGLAWLYERTGSIRAPIVVHMINNALAFAVLTTT